MSQSTPLSAIPMAAQISTSNRRSAKRTDSHPRTTDANELPAALNAMTNAKVFFKSPRVSIPTIDRNGVIAAKATPAKNTFAA